MQFKEEDLDVIYKVRVGSHSYGTNIEGSDEDFKMIYLQKAEDVLNYGYQEQVNLTKDSTAYELKRFIELCCTGNPTMLELLYSPEDCIIYKHPIFDTILENKGKFLSKSCKWSFGGYAISQIEKAKGLNKKINWEKDKIIRKNPIDFCYIVLDEKTAILDKSIGLGERIKQGVYPLKDWLKRKDYNQTDLLITKLNHSKEGYQVYFSNTETKGITVDGGNNLRTSETKKKAIPIATLLYNPDVYSQHCKEYKEYQEWLKERNVQRYVDIEGHNQKIDGKNLLHCVRLLETAIELAQEHKINVRRKNAEYLISIRKGKIDLNTIIEYCQSKLKELDEVFEKSTLKEKADRGFWLQLLPKIRKQYGNV